MAHDRGVHPQLGERRVLRPGRRLRLRAIAWFLLLFFLTAAAFGLPLQAAVDHLPPGRDALAFTGLLSASVVALGCYALAVRLGEARGASEIALRPALPGLLAGSLLGLVMMAVLMGVLAVTGLYDITPVGAAPAWTGLSLALQAAVTEELWMRALLLRLLWRAFGPAPAFTVAALVFAALHLANSGAGLMSGATVTMAGLMFCALYALTGRLWVPIGVHLAWNFAQGYVFGATVSGSGYGGSIAVSTARPGAAAWLTGGAFGPEASVFALLVLTSVTLAALVLARKAGRFHQLPPVACAQEAVLTGTAGLPASRAAPNDGGRAGWCSDGGRCTVGRLDQSDPAQQRGRSGHAFTGADEGVLVLDAQDPVESAQNASPCGWPRPRVT